MELTASAETGGVSLNRAVFNSKAVPVAREDFAERFELIEGGLGNEGVHGREGEGLFLAGFPSVRVPFAGEGDGAVDLPAILQLLKGYFIRCSTTTKDEYSFLVYS